jgi:2'-5' RNA ligase
MKRIFAAIRTEPGDDFLLAFRHLKNRLSGESIKWVEEENLHLTLKFFGETDERLVPGISDSLSLVCSGVPSFSLRLKGIGIFGSRYQPRVVWSGIDPYDKLVELMKKVQKEMVNHGFEADRQNTVPHLTLGRIKMLRDAVIFHREIEAAGRISSGSIPVSECILYESILGKSGPRYLVLKKFTFGK